MKVGALLALLAGATIGLYLPDIDGSFPFLLHRSALTHSVLIPVLLLLGLRPDTTMWKRSALIGLCTTLAVHLACDLFPVVWRGFALISLPFVGRLDGTVSMLWIAANLVASLVIVVQLAPTRTQLTVASVVGLGAFLVAAPGERVFWSALFVLLLAAWLATCVPNRVVRGQAALHWMQQRMPRRTT